MLHTLLLFPRAFVFGSLTDWEWIATINKATSNKHEEAGINGQYLLQPKYITEITIALFFVLPSVKHVVQNALFYCFPIHVSAARIDTLIGGDAHIGEKRNQISDAIYLSQ